MKILVITLLALRIRTQGCPSFSSGHSAFSSITFTADSLSKMGENPNSVLLIFEQSNPSVPIFKQVFSATVGGRPLYFGTVTGVLDDALHVLKSVSSTEIEEVLAFLGLKTPQNLTPLCKKSSETTSNLSPKVVDSQQSKLGSFRLERERNTPTVSPAGLVDQGSFTVGVNSLSVQNQQISVSQLLLGNSNQANSNTDQLLIAALNSLSPQEAEIVKNRLKSGELNNLLDSSAPQFPKAPVYKYVRKNQFNIGGIMSGTGSDKVMNPTLQLVH